LTAFWRGLRESGYVEGENVTIEYGWAQDQYDRLSDLAADLIRRHVQVIAATDTPSSIAAKTATTTLPVVFATGADPPIKEGLVTSLNRPSGNVTGVGFMISELGAKQLGLLQRLLPGAARFALLVEPTFPTTEPFVADVRAAASIIKKEIEVLFVSTGHDINAAFANLAQKRVDALLVGGSLLTANRRAQLVTLAAYHKVPAIYPLREFAEAGGLMSYGPNLTDMHRQVGVYAGQILKGRKPADLPVVLSAKFELVINLNSATAFGLNIPPELLATADEVIE
jgi:putative ABC transport system substrate-binding protein